MSSEADPPPLRASLRSASQFYLHAPARKALGGLFSGSFRSNEGEARIRALLRSSSGDEGSPRGGGAAAKSPAASPAPLAAAALNDSPATYTLSGGAALLVRFGLCEVAGLGLHHLTPNVHYDPATKTACVFTGHLQNLDELADRYSAEAFAEGPTSPSSILRASRGDPRQLAAETIQRMYMRERSGDLLVLLSELQGQFSFVLFDGEKRQVFAARDSSGSEPLYYELSDDGAVSLSNGLPHVPTDDGCVQWQELPPGHFIAGRSPKLQQFALTPAQLSIRESYERSMDEEMSPRALAMLASRARSLSPENGSGLFDDDPLFVY
ncbi:asparagine synthase (glutamine-hydrolyzing) [Micractinium conductrix]|uniref:Asparagine synthase (Glutamine-hydrolyzing) n=1 Tax=Micractinium conductrix TaxID=554055 RepID=A0A2P6VAL2_9CHLO|nr:asparagine synthase (glutamine-hydrolyzing) [Micractinium conductrix]|eukprot:PSC71115.1 asparagine synthase (glutamine-hydrolyzing) [Micractinium conductrix]